uniref:Putative UDP-glucuronosyl/UDP-glucosyltransferase n=1 Tax=Helianthus annuus TaxID=4232 RepID=A0A251TST4_HELAN
MATKQLHVVMLASPGVSHLLPILLLGHRLVTHHNLHVTVLAVTTTATTPQSLSQLITSFASHLSVIQIPAADISCVVPPDAKVATQLCVMMRETIPSIRTTISAIDSHPHVLVGDIFAYESWAIAEELGIPKYLFVTGTAWFTALFTYSPLLDKQVVGQYVDKKEPLEIPGCTPVRPDEVVDPMLNRDDENYAVYLSQAIGVTLADGMLINTWKIWNLKLLTHYEPMKSYGPW